MKISCIGAGGRYFARPLGDFAISEDIHGSQIALYDLDFERAEIMAKLARRFSSEAGADLEISVGQSLAEAVEGSDFVLASIGGAGGSGTAGYYESPVHINDCVISARYGVPQIVGDTAGPAAMAAAFRSVPIYLNICREIERSAPGAVMLNHANPMAVLCRAMDKYSDVHSAIGICHGVQGGIRHAAQILEVEPRELDTVWIGTNHYYWFTRIYHKGADMLPELWKRVKDEEPARGRRMCGELSRIYGHWIAYQSDDHVIEFYPFLAQARTPDDMPYEMGEYGHGAHLQPFLKGETTIEELRKKDESVPREESIKEYQEQVLSTKLPEGHTDPVLGEGTAQLIADIATGRRGVHILNIPNRSAVPNLPPEALLEVEAVTDSCGVRPLYMGEAPLALEGLLRKRIAWQEMVVEAAVKGDRNLALQAMMLDEQAITPDKSADLLEELLNNSKGMLPQFGLGE